ncbi:MAG: FecCD family ABC transporter permease [Chloroflexota bacterium]
MQGVGHIQGLVAHKRARNRLILIGLSASVVVTVVLATTIGTAEIAMVAAIKAVLWRMFHPATALSTTDAIITSVRLPRAVMGILVGSGLATAGCALQGLFRNPMASPWVLGVSTGAAFGASLAMLLPVSLLGLEVPAFAFALAVLTLFGVYHLSAVHGRMAVETVLLVGISLSFFFSALVAVMQYAAGDELRAITVWLMGTLSQVTWKHVWLILPIMVAGIVAIWSFSRQLNILSLDESTALHLGVETEKVKRRVMVSAAVVTAVAVSFTGPIGFVGLIVPHMARILVGPDHRLLLPVSCLAGGVFLVWVDTLARASMVEIPVGIITALLGSPFFIYLLRRTHTARCCR